MTTTLTGLITDEHRKQFREDGYFILHEAMDPDLVAGLTRSISGLF